MSQAQTKQHKYPHSVCREMVRGNEGTFLLSSALGRAPSPVPRVTLHHQGAPLMSRTRGRVSDMGQGTTSHISETPLRTFVSFMERALTFISHQIYWPLIVKAKCLLGVIESWNKLSWKEPLKVICSSSPAMSRDRCDCCALAVKHRCYIINCACDNAADFLALLRFSVLCSGACWSLEDHRKKQAAQTNQN